MASSQILFAGVLLSCFVAFTYATVGGQYSVNVHFVPPLVTAPCSIAQFWAPQNVTCALCFCMTGSLSRCIPQPGCNPQTQNSTSTTANPSSPGSNEEMTTTPSTQSDTNSNSSAPTNPGAPAPGGGTGMPAPGGEAGKPPATGGGTGMPAPGGEAGKPPATGGEAGKPPATGGETPPAPPAPAPGGEAPAAGESQGGKVRGAKPGKTPSRRRRNSRGY